MRNDALSVVSELAASPNNVFTRAQAADKGLDHRQIRQFINAGLVSEVFRGVLAAHLDGGGPSWKQQLMAATIKGAVASYRATGRLHRLDGLVDEPILE